MDRHEVSFRLHGRRYPDLEFHFVKTRTDWLAFLACEHRPDPGPAPEVPADARGGRRAAVRRPAWRFEPKLDGIRALAEMETGGTVFRRAAAATCRSSTRTST